MFRISEQMKDKERMFRNSEQKVKKYETFCDWKLERWSRKNDNSSKSGVQYGEVREKVLVLDADPQTNLTPFLPK